MATIPLNSSSRLASSAAPLHPTAPAASEDRLLIQAQSILKQLGEMNIVSHEKIISCKELYKTTDLPATIYAKFGDRLFAYVDLSMKLDAARARYKKAAEIVGKVDNLYAIHSATVHEEGIGDCGELSYEISLIAEKEGLSAKVLVLAQETLDESAGSLRDHHGVVLVSESEDSFSDHRIRKAATPVEGDFIKTMKRLRNVVIIDPYLNKAVRSTEIETDPEFIAMLLALKVTQLLQGIELRDPLEATIAQRTTIIAKAKTMGPLVEVKKLQTGEFVRLKRRDLTIDKLAKIFPATAGLWKKNDKSIFFVGSKTDVVEITKELEAMGISSNYALVKGKEDYCLFIDIQSYFAMQRVYEAITAIASNF